MRTWCVGRGDNYALYPMRCSQAHLDGASAYGRRIDVVAIPLAGLEETAIRSANAPELGLDLIRVYPGMAAFPQPK